MGKDPPDKYITKKILLKKIIDSNKILKLTKFIYNTNDLKIHIGQFIKLYLIDLYHSNKPLPIIDREFIATCCRALIINSSKGQKVQGSKKYF